jgi:hypothetical protein
MVALMENTTPKLDRAELRRNNRRIIPIFDVVVECEVFRSVDWSFGGVHLDGVCEGVKIGTSVEGWITVPETRTAFAFTGSILRTDPTTGNTVLRFDEMEAGTADFLDRAVAARLH